MPGKSALGSSSVGGSMPGMLALGEAPRLGSTKAEQGPHGKGVCWGRHGASAGKACTVGIH